MRNSLARIQKLEQRMVRTTRLLVRCGFLRRISAAFEGERHIAIVDRRMAPSSTAEWCEFEERAGRSSTPELPSRITIYLTPTEESASASATPTRK